MDSCTELSQPHSPCDLDLKLTVRSNIIIMFLVQCKTGFKFTETKIEAYKRVAFRHFSVKDKRNVLQTPNDTLTINHKSRTEGGSTVAVGDVA